MAGHYHNRMDLLTATDVERIYHITDQMQLHRDWVVVPLNCANDAFEIVQPDGKLLLRPPGGELLDSWIDGLADRLSEIDLSRTVRLGMADPGKHLSGSQAPRSVGTPRYLPGRDGLGFGRHLEIPLTS